jgi:hypothetical protein
VSFRLVDEVLAGMPADLSAGERLVLLVLAHHADETSRECWPGMDLLRFETGMHSDSVRKALTRLERRGIDLRASVAYSGRVMVYRIPSFRRRADHPNDRTQRPTKSPDATSAHSQESQDVTSPLVGRNVRESQDATSYPQGHEPKEPSGPNTEDGMTRRDDKPEPLDATLAVFSQSHPGREREAFDAALRWYAKTHTDPLVNPAAFFGTFSIERLASQIKLPKPAKPTCRICDGDGFLLDPDTSRPIERCQCKRSTTAA